MYGDRTELTLHIDFVKGQWIRIAKNTTVKADGKDYAVKSATVFKLGEQYTMHEDTLNFVLTFEPVPATTEKLDLVEPGGWCVMNIRRADWLPEGIANTYWRDEATGSSASHLSMSYMAIGCATSSVRRRRRAVIR